eukprot:IDg17306t1
MTGLIRRSIVSFLIRQMRDCSPHPDNTLVVTEFRQMRCEFGIRPTYTGDPYLDCVFETELCRILPVVRDCQ